MTHRRDFLTAMLASASLAALPAVARKRVSADKPPQRKPGQPLRILVLGGTGFLGPHFVEAIAGKTLATIKAIVEDRDPRFDPNGRPRS